MKKHLTNFQPLIDKILADKMVGKFRLKPAYGHKGIYSYLREIMIDYEPSVGAIQHVPGLSKGWVEWFETRVKGSDLPFHLAASEAARYLKMFLHQDEHGDVTDELQHAGTLFLELSYLFPESSELVTKCIDCNQELTSEEIADNAIHECPAHRYGGESNGVFQEEKKIQGLPEHIKNDVIKGCYLCGGPLRSSMPHTDNKYCYDHDPNVNPSSYRTARNRAIKVIEYLEKNGELPALAVPANFVLEDRLRQMWGAINRRFNCQIDWDLMQIRFNEMVIMTHPQMRESIDKNQKVKAMLDKGCSQSEIAKSLGVSRSAVSQLVKKIKN